MTIYFNPLYDSSVFLKAEDCGLGKTFLGREALLSELELRAGLTGVDNEHSDRVIAYMEAMAKAQRPAPLFYSGSFDLDDYGTAELMLGWRDALVKAGWNGQAVGKSEKIRVLSLIEYYFDCPGSADRWRAMLSETKKRPILKPTDRIEVQCPKDAIDPVLEELFDKINAHYVTPVVEYKSAAVPLGEKSVSVKEFDNEYTAHEWIAAQNLGEKDVIAEADQVLLGDMFHIQGKPGIGATDEGIGAVMRLLPLGLSLFAYPADINRLQSYLQSPLSPLRKLHSKVQKNDGTYAYPNVTGVLFDHICSEGGFGPEWDKILTDAIYDFDGKTLSGKDRTAALKFIGMWEHSKSLSAGEAPADKVIAFIEGLNKWAGAKTSPDNGLNAQFQALQRQCGALLRLVKSHTGTISVGRLNRWASHLCTPIDISSDYARLGSINVVSNVADIFSGAERLIWFASTTENGVPYDYDFLSPSEMKDLRASGVHLEGKEKAARSDKACKLEGLCRCGDVTIVTCRRISGVETVQSALLAEINKNYPPIAGAPIAKTGTASVNTDFGKKAIHKFDPAILNGFSRKCESYSSIDALLMSPTDYLLDYLKGYRQYGIKGVADIPTTEGNVAHAYIEELGKRCSLDPNAMKAMHAADYEVLLGEVISDKGLILLSEANRLEEKSFRVSLKESVEVILDIITDNKLDIVGFEHQLTANLTNIGQVIAKIDCLLKDPADGKYVIFDFKYSSSLHYEHKIEQNRELQLAIYRKVVEEQLGAAVKFIGYYAIPRKTIYTPENTLKPNNHIHEVKQTSMDIFTMAAKGYVYRWSQLRNGILEEGEGLPLADFDYSKQSNLYPLKADNEEKIKNKKEIKARAFGNKNITLKGGLK